MSTRKITSEQFSDGTTIDGGRVDKALQDIVDYINLVPVDAESNSFCKKQIVAGYSPRVFSYTPHAHPGLPGSYNRPRELPWCPMSLTNESGEPSKTRMKGTDPAGVYPTTRGTGYVWSIPFRTDKPVVISNIDLALHTDEDAAYYPNDWTWNVNGPGNISTGDWVEDVYIQVQVENYINGADPREDDIIVTKKEFSLDAQFFNPLQGWDTDMYPSIQSERMNGAWLEAKDVNVPVPANSNVRILMFLPDYLNAKSSDNVALAGGDVRWLRTNTQPGEPAYHGSFSMQGYSMTLTYLERKG